MNETKGLLKNVIVKKDCIIFLSHADDAKLEILKPIPIPRIVKYIEEISDECHYLNTKSFLEFLEKSVNTDPDLVKEMKDDGLNV